jgi:hypothetical protein
MIANLQLWSTVPQRPAPPNGLPPKEAKFCHTSNILLVGHQCRRALWGLYFNSSEVGHQLLVVGHWSLVVSRRSLVVGCQSSVISCWSLVICCWSSVVGCWLSVVGCWSLVYQKLHHVPYYIDILLNHLGMFNLGIISTIPF